MIKLLRCKVCGATFPSLDEVEYHFYNTDETHERLVEEVGIRELIEEEEEYPQAYPQVYPMPYPVPYPVPIQQEKEENPKPTNKEIVPYAHYPIKVTENIYSNLEKNMFFDSVTKKEYTSEALIDFLKQSERQDELIKFLKWRTKNELKRIAESTGVYINDRELEKASEQELLGKLFRAYFSQPEARESLSLYVASQEEELLKFFNGESDHCAFCNRHKNNYFSGKEYELNKILKELKIPTKSHKETDDILTNRGLSFTYRGHEGFMPLRVFIHLCLEHPQRFQRLIEEKALVFKNKQVGEYVESREKQQEVKKKQPSKEQLSQEQVDRLEAIRQWLNKRVY